jgi:hypothetical protein
VRVRNVAAWWLATDAARETILTDQLCDICGQEAAREIMQLVDEEVEAIRQKGEETGREEPSAALPRAA